VVALHTLYCGGVIVYMDKYIVEFLIDKIHCPNLEDTSYIADKFLNVLRAFSKASAYLHNTYSEESERIAFKFEVESYVTPDCSSILKDAQSICQVCLVDVRNKKFIFDKDAYFCWENEGSTAYHGGGKYVDSSYRLYVNGREVYCVTDLDVERNRLSGHCPRKYTEWEELKNAKYVWGCTCSWDNVMRATNLTDALEEFEKLYEEILLNSVEHLKQEVSNRIDAYINFRKCKYKNN
jgi:hypothetical protein